MVKKSQIIEAIELLKTHNLSSLEVQYSSQSSIKVTQQLAVHTTTATTVADSTQAAPAPLNTPPEQTHNPAMHSLNSPLVGTVYLAPSPDDPPFVQVGDTVSKGQSICLVEAMKTFNEVPASHAGVIEKVLVQNGDGVEFEQPLFIIRPHP